MEQPNVPAFGGQGTLLQNMYADTPDTSSNTYSHGPQRSYREGIADWDIRSANMSLGSPYEPHQNDSRRPSSTGSLDQHYPLVRIVYEHCLHISQDYITSFRANYQQRCPDAQIVPVPFLGASMPTTFNSNDAGVFYRQALPTESLKTNVSTVCAILWARAWALQLLDAHEELNAVMNMGSLNQATDWICGWLDSVNSGHTVPGLEARSVIDAGKQFCEALEDYDAANMLERLGAGT